MSLKDARAAIRLKMDAEHARVAVVWSDGETDEFDLDPRSFDVRPHGGLVARTTDDEQLLLSPAVEWVLLDGT